MDVCRPARRRVVERVGGGAYDPATDTWGQGAFNADDISRDAVAFLRHHELTGSASSRDQARQLLRGLTSMQTTTGPDAGNVVLWMQPDGTLNPSAQPVELPDPSDSADAYWVARTIWALGEGYATFVDDDPAFAAFLADRMQLSIDAVHARSWATTAPPRSWTGWTGRRVADRRRRDRGGARPGRRLRHRAQRQSVRTVRAVATVG